MAVVDAPPEQPGSLAVQEAQESRYPVLRSERTWGRWAFVAVCASLAAGTWNFPIGGAIAAYLPAWSGTFVMVAGMMIGMGFLLVGTLPMLNRYGLDSVSGTAPYLGVRGSYLGLLLVWAPVAAWNAILTIILGRSVVRILDQIGVIHVASSSIAGWGNVAGVVCLLVIVVFVTRGPALLKRLEIALTFMVVALFSLVFVLLFAKFGGSRVDNAKALAPYDDHQLNVVTVVELMIGAALSWWPWVGGLVRLVPSAPKALPGYLIGLGIAVPFTTAGSLYSALVAEDPDPSSWMLTVGGTGWGVVALLLVICANVGTIAANLFVAGVASNRVKPVQRNVSWGQNLIVAALPVAAIVLFFGDTFLEQTPKVLAFSGLFYGPLAGIAAADYLILRRGRISLRGVYDTSPGAPYYYWGGFNPVGIVAALTGFVVYRLLLNPLTFDASGPFKWMTASIPAFVVAGAVYLLLTRLIVIPAGKGNHLADRASA